MAGMEILLSAILMNISDGLSTTLAPPIDSNMSITNIERNKLATEYNGKHLIIGTVNNYPLNYVEVDENNTLIGKGHSFDFINILKEKYNFTYEVVVPPDNLELSEDKMQKTLIGMLIDKKIDMAAAFLSVMPDLAHNVTYSTNLDEAEWMIMMKRPTESATGSGLLAPFDAVVWYMVLISVLFFGPFVYAMAWIRYVMTKDDTNKPFKLPACVWFVYGGLLKQGTTLSPEANSTRLLFATWWIFITLLSAFYTANLTAFLTLSKFTLSINDPKDLLKKNNKWVAKKGGSFEYIVNNPLEDLSSLKTMVQNKKGVFVADRNDTDWITYIEDDYVFIRDKPGIEVLMYDDYKKKKKNDVKEELRCTFVLTTKAFMRNARAFAFPKDSKLPKLFNSVLLSVVEAGMVKFKTSSVLPGTPICPLNLKSTERRLRNADLQLTYVLAGAGIAVAIVSFLIELCNHHSGGAGITNCLTCNGKKNRDSEPVSDRADGNWSSSPPPYQAIFGHPYGTTNNMNNKIKNVNGRDYWVVQLPSGDSRLIPVRTPSAFLFQYST